MNEEDLETISYDEPQEDLFAGESIIAAANKVIDFLTLMNLNKNKKENFKNIMIN